MVKQAPYGAWNSPITPKLITKATPGLDQPTLDGDNLYFLQSRPWESGRTVVMRRTADGTIEDVLPAPLSARSRVHEYGGFSYLVVEDILYFSLDTDQRLYQLDLSKDAQIPEPLTPDNQWRYSDYTLDRNHNRLIAVAEVPVEDEHLPRNLLVTIPLDGSQNVEELVTGDDFYSNPRLSPDGTTLSWLSWNHPQMPWDGTSLFTAAIGQQGILSTPERIAGSATESIFQPQWSPDGCLYFVSDRSNWWNIYRANPDGSATAICPMEAECATPQWLFGMSCYGFVDAKTIACCFTRNNFWELGTIDIERGKLTNVDTSYSDIQSLFARDGRALFIAATPTTGPSIGELADGRLNELFSSESLPFSDNYLAPPEAISYPTGQGETAHALLYRPTNPDYSAPEGELPPLMVMCHGGPTASATVSLNFKAQFWASRGFAVLDVNYRGSTGFGRDYRDSLQGFWGIKDVDDVSYGVKYLAQQGVIDPERTAIRGGSAGGFTALAALTFTDSFKAGASLYGIGDLELLANDTHKFEARYLDGLIGPYPDAKQTYFDRSPLNHVEQLTCPVIFLQGLEDKVVPPIQAETMVKALKEKSVPVAYVTFEGEGHGFRQAANIQRAFEAELYFYSQVFGFELEQPVPSVEIDNLSRP